MIAGTLLQAMLVTRLRGVLTGASVFEAPPVRSARPCVVVDMPVLSDWGTKDAAGREGRVVVQLFDDGEVPERLRTLAAVAEAAVLSAPAVLAGWQIVSLVFMRSRVVRDGKGWVGSVEFRVRMLVG